MIYSVWNQGLGAFDYFESPDVQEKLNAPKPAHLVNRTLGSTVDQAAWPLPGNVRKIGSGAEAIGRVATRKTQLSLGDTSPDLSIVKAGLLVASAYLIWRYVVKAPRRRHA